MDMQDVKEGISSFFNDAKEVFGDSYQSLTDCFSRVMSGDVQTEDVVTLAAGGLSGVFLGSVFGAGTMASLGIGVIGMMAGTYIKENFIDQPEVAPVPVMPASPTNIRNMQP